MIGFIGGTGPEGRGLALRFAMAGESVMIGSRDAGRAIEAADSVTAIRPGLPVTGGLNQQVASDSDIVFVAVPYAGHRPTLESLHDILDGKLIVDVVAPLAFSRGVASAIVPEAGSAAEEAQQILTNCPVIGAFHNLSAEELLEPETVIDADVIVCGEDAEAKSRVIELAELIAGIRGVDGGGLANSRYVENLTALLININRIYRAHSTIKLVGI